MVGVGVVTLVVWQWWEWERYSNSRTLCQTVTPRPHHTPPLTSVAEICTQASPAPMLHTGGALLSTVTLEVQSATRHCPPGPTTMSSTLSSN